MDIAEFDDYCAGFPGSNKVIQWGGAHVWKVDDKVFAIASHWGKATGQDEWRYVFKVSDIAWEMFRDHPGVVPAPYLGRAKWVQVEDPASVTKEDLRSYIGASYQIIARKLTKRRRTELGLI